MERVAIAAPGKRVPGLEQPLVHDSCGAVNDTDVAQAVCNVIEGASENFHMVAAFQRDVDCIFRQIGCVVRVLQWTYSNDLQLKS